jgi:molybdenum cofactor cytidylyltransferase
VRAAILLAAGASRRFGRPDKLAARIGRRAVLDHALALARASGAVRLIVVARAPHRASARERWLRTPLSRAGMGGSLAAALAALRPVEREVLIFLADMPFAAAPRRLRLDSGEDAARPIYRGRPGHPLLVRTAVARRLVRAGDDGLVRRLDPARVRLVRGERGAVLDIDTPVALRRARREGSRRRR